MDGIKNYLTDMDGVLVQGRTLLPGAAEFVQRLQTQGIPFLVMDYVPGGTLRDRYPDGSVLPLPEVVNYVSQVAAATSPDTKEQLVTHSPVGSHHGLKASSPPNSVNM